MDNRWYSGKQEMHNKRQLRNNEAYEATILEDLAEDFRLPIDHRVTENVDLDNVEQASLDTQLPSSNIGFRLLQKMGWKGKGLGKDEQGIIEPIKSGIRDAKLGLGKQEEDDYFTAEENIQRRKLDIEVEETEELAKKREKAAYSIYVCLLMGWADVHKQQLQMQNQEETGTVLLLLQQLVLLQWQTKISEKL
ncbi:UNVERIFIED_CONTAM: Septin and tuftelin-interacting protein 12 [Sesamum angustifolium]|uniref:Septin and tuftelin-interacting protein 12 n=1 Tax=Sesamum angustifolium TaxID=2727405 RepID=A0AAW2K9X8_9LAMI